MSIAHDPVLDTLGREHPEWQPWLAPLTLAVRHAADRAYDAAVPEVADSRDADAPLLDRIELRLDPRVANAHLRALLHAAATPGTPAASLADAARFRALDALAVIDAAIPGDTARLAEIAGAAGADADALTAIAALAVIPLLQACARRWCRRIGDWRAGYCPVCGAWPAFAEERGLERARRLRCARCGGDWGTEWLRCVFCSTDDHARLGSLVPAAGGASRKVETCSVCRGYLKSVTTLAPTPPTAVAVTDLATVALDLAALDAGYHRPPGLGRPPAARVLARARRSWLR